MFHNIDHALIRVSQTIKPLNIHYKPPYQVQNLSMKIDRKKTTTEKLKIEQKKSCQLQSVRDECYPSRCRDKQVRCLPKTPATEPQEYRREGKREEKQSLVSCIVKFIIKLIERRKIQDIYTVISCV